MKHGMTCRTATLAWWSQRKLIDVASTRSARHPPDIHAPKPSKLRQKNWRNLLLIHWSKQRLRILFGKKQRHIGLTHIQRHAASRNCSCSGALCHRQSGPYSL